MRAALLTLCLLALSGVCHAEKIFRWTDNSGKIVYGDLPPANASQVVEIDRRTASAGKGSASANSSATTAAQDVVTRDAECDQKRAQLATYENAARLIEKDNLGREREFSEEEKAMLIGRTEVEIDVLCGGFD